MLSHAYSPLIARNAYPVIRRYCRMLLKPNPFHFVHPPDLFKEFAEIVLRQ